MSRLVICVVVCALGVCLAGAAQAAPIYVYDGGVGNGTWHDVEKVSVTGNPDSLLCWAAASSAALSWTGWYGWDSGSSSLISSAADIYAEFDAGWSNRIGAPTYAYEWWMTNRTSSILPGGITFDSAGRNFYPGVDVMTGTSVTAFVKDDAAAGNEIYTWLDNYINDDRAIVASIDVPSGPGVAGAYSHSLTVWGWDKVTNQIFVTDSDDGTSGLRTYSFSTAGDKVTINNYSNRYTSSTNVLITQITRLNLNSTGLLPNGYTEEPGGGDDTQPVVPEPSTIALLGIGVLGMIVLRRRKSAIK